MKPTFLTPQGQAWHRPTPELLEVIVDLALLEVIVDLALLEVIVDLALLEVIVDLAWLGVTTRHT